MQPTEIQDKGSSWVKKAGKGQKMSLTKQSKILNTPLTTMGESQI